MFTLHDTTLGSPLDGDITYLTLFLSDWQVQKTSGFLHSLIIIQSEKRKGFIDSSADEKSRFIST